jgi:predicted DNA-binding protein (MmcQ/YjbR family)
VKEVDKSQQVNHRNAEPSTIQPFNIETLRDYCLSKPGVSESFPFDETTLVFKVMGKMFALIDIEARPLRVALKCDPERAVQLRDEFPGVEPAFHMSKTHWNQVVADGSIRADLIRAWIDDSYDLVCRGLTKAARTELAALAVADQL